MNDTIKCPHCKEQIEINTVLAAQLREELKGEFEKSLSEEKKRLAEEIVKKTKAELELQLTEYKTRAEELEQKNREFQQHELALRKQARALEEQKQVMELEVARKLDAERKMVEEAVLKRAADEHHLKDMEKEKQLDDMRKQIEELKHKAELGSQQARGEILELDLEAILRNAFASDDIAPVGKGVLGADIVQHVRNRYGKLCEKIVWESKRTKHWSDQWVEKLKDDSRKMHGFVSVIVTETLPVGIDCFAYYNGVWVTDYSSIVGLATALRMQIIHVCHVRDSMTGKDEKMEMLYEYLTSHQFRARVEAIVETFQSMRIDLEKEKEAMRRLWVKRDKEISRITENTIGMYGEMQGLIGSSLPTLPALDLTALTEDSEDSDESQTISLPLQ